MQFVPVTVPPSAALAGAVEELVGDARMVVLGEEMHGDGATFAAKAQLAQVLFEHFGFDTMGWESPIYDVQAMNELDASVEVDSFAGRGLFAIWHGREIEPLLQYCRRRAIEHAGIDCQFLDDAGQGVVATAVAGWSDQCGVAIEAQGVSQFIAGQDDALAGQLERLVRVLAGRSDPWPSMVVSNVLANRRQQRLGAAIYGPYQAARLRGEVVELNAFDPVLIACNSARDEAMAANAVRLVESGRRVVLWAANYHALRSLADIEPYASKAPSVRTLGDYLHEQVGSLAKIVVGTSLRGTRWDFDRWTEASIHERTADCAEHGWPTGETAQLAVVGPHDLIPGPVHLVGVGPMQVAHPARHFDAVLHVEVQRPPKYSRW